MTVTAPPRCALIGERYRRNRAVLALFDDVVPLNEDLVVSHATANLASLHTSVGTVPVHAADLDRCFVRLAETTSFDEINEAKTALVRNPYFAGKPIVREPGASLRRTAVPLGSLYDDRIPYGARATIKSVQGDTAHLVVSSGGAELHRPIPLAYLTSAYFISETT